MPDDSQAERARLSNRALLKEALRVIYGERDSYYARLVTWHNKTMWLLVVGLMLVVALALYHAPIFLLAGAVGGFLSRMFRVVRTDRVPTDYGAFWTSLFLSPLLGALAGWTGVLLVSALAQADLLGDAFRRIEFDPPAASTADAVAPGVPAPRGVTASPGPTETIGAALRLTAPGGTATAVAVARTALAVRPTTAPIATRFGRGGSGSQAEGIRSDRGSSRGEAPFPNVMTLALAALFGFSERLFAGVADRLQGAVTPSDGAADGTTGGKP